MKQINDFIKPLRGILEGNHNGVLVSSRTGKIIYCNPAFENLSGLKISNLKGKNLAELFPRLNIKELDKNIAKELSVHLDLGFASGMVIQRKKNHASAFHLGSLEQPVGLLLIFQTQNTESDIVIDKYKKAHNPILRVMDSRTDTGWVLSDLRTGNNIFVSQGMEALTGWSLDEFYKGGWSFGLSNIHEDDTEQVVATFQTNLEQRTRQPFIYDHISWESDFRYRKKTGEYLPMSSQTSVLERDELQNINYLISSFSLSFKSPKEKDIAGFEHLKDGAVKIIEGETYINLNFLQSIKKKTADNLKQDNHIDLSDRELEVLKWMTEGLSSIKIAKILNVSPHTVITHRKQLLKKMQAKNAAELVRKAEKMGLF